MTVDELLVKTEELFNEMIKKGDQLKKAEVLNILTPKFAPFVSQVISGLVEIGKINRKRGQGGGIEYNPRKRAERRLTDSNKYGLRSYFQANLISVEEKKNNTSFAERDMYEPLLEYLLSNSYYDFVEKIGDERPRDAVWENPDLVACEIQQTKYKPDIQITLTAFEVKKQMPEIRDIMQCVSYLCSDPRKPDSLACCH